MTTATVATILSNISTVLTTIWTVFSDMIDAVTSNPWLLITILFGFSSTVISIAFKVIRRARRI